MGIIYETTVSYSLASNGVVERKNRTLIELTNAMLIESGAHLHFWCEAILIACHVLNRVPHKKSSTTPFEMWKWHKSNLGYLRVWDCLAYVRLTNPKIHKLGIRATTCTFLDYAINSAAYKFFGLKKKIIFESGDAIFHEEKFSFKLKNSRVKKIFCHILILLLLIYKIKKILKWNLEGVKELELILIIMFLTLRKISKI